MFSYLIRGLLILSCFAISTSKAGRFSECTSQSCYDRTSHVERTHTLSIEEKYYLMESVAEWDDAPKPERIEDGTVTIDAKGTKNYNFVYDIWSSKRSKCDANMELWENGSGHYGWECRIVNQSSNGHLDEEPSSSYDESCDSCDTRRRRMHPGKKFKMKGTGKLKPKTKGSKSKKGAKGLQKKARKRNIGTQNPNKKVNRSSKYKKSTKVPRKGTKAPQKKAIKGNRGTPRPK